MLDPTQAGASEDEAGHAGPDRQEQRVQQLPMVELELLCADLNLGVRQRREVGDPALNQEGDGCRQQRVLEGVRPGHSPARQVLATDTRGIAGQRAGGADQPSVGRDQLLEDLIGGSAERESHVPVPLAAGVAPRTPQSLATGTTGLRFADGGFAHGPSMARGANAARNSRE